MTRDNLESLAPHAEELGDSKIQALLPSGPYGPRTGDRFAVTLGRCAQSVGELRLYLWGRQTCSEFRYDDRWLKHRRFFALSPELRPTLSGQFRQAPKIGDQALFSALADAAPSGFALAVLRRAQARGLLEAFCRAHGDPTVLHTLGTVLDTCSLGALRIRPIDEAPTDAMAERHLLPRRCDLGAIAAAVAAFERGQEDLRELLLLLYCATALGGSRPKCSWIQENGELAVAKFPSMHDHPAVNRVEVLAMRMAHAAGIVVVPVQLQHPVHEPFVLAARFDRKAEGGRRPFLSARSLMLAHDEDTLDTTELLSAMRMHCKDFATDAQQLWRRWLFGHLINAAGDTLRKTGFLYAGQGRWYLAPAHGLRPSLNASKREAAGDRFAAIEHLVENCSNFEITPAHARAYLRQQLDVIAGWRKQSAQFPISLCKHDMEMLTPVMDNQQQQLARQLVR
jgi:serine/threonine-protein kinase HipA